MAGQAEAALDVSTGQIATEEGFDFYIEQPLPLGLCESVQLFSGLFTDQNCSQCYFYTIHEHPRFAKLSIVFGI